MTVWTAKQILEQHGKTHIQINRSRIIRRDSIADYYHSLRILELHDGTVELVEDEFAWDVRDEMSKRKKKR